LETDSGVGTVAVWLVSRCAAAAEVGLGGIRDRLFCGVLDRKWSRGLQRAGGKRRENDWTGGGDFTNRLCWNSFAGLGKADGAMAAVAEGLFC